MVLPPHLWSDENQNDDDVVDAVADANDEEKNSRTFRDGIEDRERKRERERGREREARAKKLMANPGPDCRPPNRRGRRKKRTE